MSVLRVAILAGGQSTRMGTDKACLRLAGETLLVRTARLAGAATQTIPVVVGRERPDDWPGDGNALFLPDALPAIGPLGGLVTALRAFPDTSILALSCDLPGLTEEAIRYLIGQTAGMYGVITRTGERYQPLFSLYAPAARGLMEANIDQGRHSLHAVIAAGGDGFAVVPVAAEMANALINVNTREEWDRFQTDR